MDKMLIISVHGIFSNIDASDAWQHAFDIWLRSFYAEEMQSTNLVHLPFSYGILGPIGAWTGVSNLSMSLSVNRFTKFLRAVIKAYPGYKIHIVAHSFGTWVVHQTLNDYPEWADITGLHLFGGVISAHIQKNYLDETLMWKQVQYCVVWSSHNDLVVRFLAIPPFGHIGYWGIIRNYTEDRIRPVWQPYEYISLYNRVTDHGHNDCLIPETFAILMKDIENEPQA